jgi:hypothetical protein
MNTTTDRQDARAKDLDRAVNVTRVARRAYGDLNLRLNPKWIIGTMFGSRRVRQNARCHQTRTAGTSFLRIAILLGAMPRMLHEVVSEVFGAESDMHVVADGVGETELVDRVDREQPDVVVLAVPSGPPPAVCGELMRRFPTLTILALEQHGETASMYLLRPMRFRLTDVSGRQIVSGIRSAVQSRSLASEAVYADAGVVNMTRPSAARPE